MLERPSCGWVDVHLGDFCDRASYLTDVIYDVLEALIQILECNGSASASVYFDAEGWEWYMVFTWYETFIIDYPYRTDEEYMNSVDDKPELTVIDMRIEDIAKEVIKDFEKDYDEWISWNPEGESEERTKELEGMIEKLKKIVGEEE